MRKKICIIPARRDSTRLKEKIYIPINGIPLCIYTYRKAVESSLFDEVFLAGDDPKTEKIAKDFRADYISTPKGIASGTLRAAFCVKQRNISDAFIVNWQADEPLLSYETIKLLIAASEKEREADVFTLKHSITEESDIADRNVVKVVTNKFGYALYFSRSPLKQPHLEGIGYKHIGVYGFTSESLIKIPRLSESSLEVVEKLEQLRCMDHGMKIFVETTDEMSVGIDTESDIEALNKLI